MSKLDDEKKQKTFKDNFAEDQAKADVERQEIAEADFGSIRERLMARSKLLIINVPMEDGNGDFSIKCRAFTVKEQTEVFGILDEFRKLTLEKGNPKANPKKILERYNKGIETTKILLAYPNGICLNKELNLEFWNSGQYTSDMPFYVMRYVMDHQAEAVRNAVLFREANRRKISKPTMRKSRA